MLHTFNNQSWFAHQAAQAAAVEAMTTQQSSSTNAGPSIAPASCMGQGWSARCPPPPLESADRNSIALRRAQSELRLISAALLSSQEMERKRIANELHDSIGQAVGNLHFGIAISLEMIRDGNTHDAENMLIRLSTQAKQAIEEIRRIAMDLRPASLDDLGIVRTLSWFFREFRSVHPELGVNTEITVDEADIPANLANTIYRVVQEGCNNVIRHAEASEIQVALHRLTGAIHLRIEDNGQGLAAAYPQCTDRKGPGLGLCSMRDRVELSGGCFCLESKPGFGTCILANWQLTGGDRERSACDRLSPTFI